jgi:hypothetical protein
LGKSNVEKVSEANLNSNPRDIQNFIRIEHIREKKLQLEFEIRDLSINQGLISRNEAEEKLKLLNSNFARLNKS